MEIDFVPDRRDCEWWGVETAKFDRCVTVSGL